MSSSGLAGDRQPPQHWAPDEHGFRSECECFDDVGSTAEAPVDVHFDSLFDRVDNARERIDGRGCPVESSATMVRDHQGRDSCLSRQAPVFRMDDALDDDGKRRGRANPLEVLPRERRVE